MGQFMKNLIADVKNNVENGVFRLSGNGAPVSGAIGSLGLEPTGINIAGPGSLYTDIATGVVFFNEGTAAAPYWTPINYNQRGLLSWFSDFRDGVGKALADTATTLTAGGSGIRTFGQGIDETDSGLVIAIGEDGAIGSLTTTDEAAHVAALGVGISGSVPFQPDRHGPITIDVLMSMSSLITLRAMFCGFLGTAADALDPPATGSGTTITLVQDDMAGLFQSVGLTATSRFFAPHNKSDEAATIATTATGVDTGVNLAAAGTYQRLRVEISPAGIMTCFIDKTQVTQISASLDTDEEIAPVLAIMSTSAATKTMLVKQFAAWGYRPSGL